MEHDLVFRKRSKSSRGGLPHPKSIYLVPNLKSRNQNRLLKRKRCVFRLNPEFSYFLIRWYKKMQLLNFLLNSDFQNKTFCFWKRWGNVSSIFYYKIFFKRWFDSFGNVSYQTSNDEPIEKKHIHVTFLW